MNQIEKITKALSDKNRIKIFDLLTKEPLKVSEVAYELDIEENLASHHLRVMSRNGILKSTKKGREVFYSINRIKLVNTLKSILKKQYVKDLIKEAQKNSK